MEENLNIAKQNKYSKDEIQKLNPAFYKKYVTNLQGKDFMTYNGLIALGKAKGIISLDTEIVQFPSPQNGDTCIIKATIVGFESVNGVEREVTYTGYGDANVGNCNKMVGRHFIRMAETRAKGRALRDFTGIDMTMSEELGGDVFENNDPSKKTITPEQMKLVGDLMQQGGWNKTSMQEFSKGVCGTSDIKSYTMAMADHLIQAMKSEMNKAIPKQA